MATQTLRERPPLAVLSLPNPPVARVLDRNELHRSYLGRVWLLMRSDKAALFGAFLVLAPVMASVLAPLIAPHDPLAIESTKRLLFPGADGYLLGTDAQGRDMLSRLLYGGRISLLAAVFPLLIAGLSGCLLGLLSGSTEGRLDHIIMRLMDVLMAFPSLLLAIAIVTIMGRGMFNAVLAISIVAIPAFARITRGAILAVKRLEYVEAARAIGASPARVVFHHMLPNALGPVIVFTTLEAGRMMIFSSGLAFLGLGVTPPTPEWGAMLSDGRSVLPLAPHVATIPGLVIFAVCLGLNLVGDSLQDALDPRSASQVKGH